MRRVAERQLCVCIALVGALGLTGCSKEDESSGDDDAQEEEDQSAQADDDDDEADDDDSAEERDTSKKDAGKTGQSKDGGAGSTKDAGKGSKSDGSVSAPNDAGSAGGMNTGTVPTPTFVDGPADGDPSKPIVSIPEAACGGSAGLDGFVGGNFGGFPVPGTPNIQIGGRDVILTYPCNKHEGAQVTFILNLHGTMPDEGLKLYQHSYFAAHKLANSHNLIVASPKSVVSQWGNGDEGKDAPHLYEVIDWVYEKFSKFQITGLWVGGHSWGSAYAKTFVCDEMLRERARGVIGMSGGASGVGGFGGFLGGGGGAGGSDCANRLSQIHTVGDQEGGESGVPDQTAAAMQHGCDARLAPMDIGEGQMLYDWPNCDAGWTHFNFVMGAHQHTTPINDAVVKYIVEQIKATEKGP